MRSRISIIPQEPILFSSTMRRNLDPYEIYEDSELWRVLEEVLFEILSVYLISELT